MNETKRAGKKRAGLAVAATVVMALAMAVSGASADVAFLSNALSIAGGNRIVATGKAEQFDRSSVYEYSDGAADIYLDGGFTALFVRQYEVKGSAKGNVEIAAYDMGSVLRAVGLFQTLAEGHTVAQSGGLATISTTRRTVFYKGVWLIEMVDKSDTDLPTGTLAAAATALGNAIAGKPAIPVEYARLPKKGMVAGSERYVHRNFLSRSYLSGVLAACYTVDAAVCTLFISQHDSSAAARKSFDRLATSLGAAAAGDTVSSQAMAAVVNGPYIVGVTGFPGREKAIALIKECITLIH